MFSEAHVQFFIDLLITIG